jgi:hypothetical protein
MIRATAAMITNAVITVSRVCWSISGPSRR